MARKPLRKILNPPRRSTPKDAQAAKTAPVVNCPKLGDFVFVEWDDACGSPRWASADDTQVALSSIVSSGFLVAREANRITLSGDLDRSAGNVGRLISIPTGGITGIKVIVKECAERGFFLLSDAQKAAMKAAIITGV